MASRGSIPQYWRCTRFAKQNSDATASPSLVCGPGQVGFDFVQLLALNMLTISVWTFSTVRTELTFGQHYICFAQQCINCRRVSAFFCSSFAFAALWGSRSALQLAEGAEPLWVSETLEVYINDFFLFRCLLIQAAFLHVFGIFCAWCTFWIYRCFKYAL